MPATPQANVDAKPVHESSAIPPQLSRPLAANAQVGFGQFVTVDPTSGMAALNDGTVPNQICAGVGNPATLSDTSAVAGEAYVRLSQRHIKGVPASALGGDGFDDTDFAVPFWIADENTPGKLTNQGGNNRSMGGLVFGLDFDGHPILWDGPVAWLLARAAHLADNFVGADGSITDGAAADVTAERAMSRQPVHGVVTGIEFIGAAVAASAANYATITVRKHDGAGGASVVLGTYSSQDTAEGAINAFEPASFTLSAVAGALNLLETDIVTVQVAKTGTGQVISGAVRLVQKVI